MIEIDWTGLLDNLITAMIVIVAVGWVLGGAFLGLIWGSITQRTDSEVVAILYGIFVIPFILLYEVTIADTVRSIVRFHRQFYPLPPPPPKPARAVIEPHVPRARPPVPDSEHEYKFDYDEWRWVKKELDK